MSKTGRITTGTPASTREDPGLGWQFHTWDQEIGLDQLVRNRTEVDNSNSPAELYDELRRSPEFRLRVADRLQALFFNDGAFTEENNQARWMQRANQIEAAIIGESARWGDAREGQRVTAYSSRSPLPDGTGQIPRGTRTVPLMTVDHWRDSVTYVNETFFTGADDIFLSRMRADGLFPDTAAPTFSINGQPQHGGEAAMGSILSIQGTGDIYFTLDGSDPRKVGGDVQGQKFESAISFMEETTVHARVLSDGEWSPLVTATFKLAGPEGDLDNDGVVNSHDIDAILAAIAAENPESKYDLNEDAELTEADADYLIETLLNTRRGDLDLNGKVEFADFLIFSGNFGGAAEAIWSNGDIDGSGEMDFADFLILSANFGFENSND